MKLIDISHVINNQTPVFPGDYDTSLSKFKNIGKDHYNAFLLKSCLHTGTHIDVPSHLSNDVRMVADFPVDAFTGRGVLLDARGEDIIPMKPEYIDLIPEGCIVLVHTGFDKHYFNNMYFTGHPALSHELADFLISRKIKMLGVDIPSPDRLPYPIHRSLLANGVFVLENLTNLESLLGVPEFEVIALPLKIDAEASFTRAVCMIK